MSSVKQITCTSPLKKGLDVITTLRDIGIYTANRSTQKGTSINSKEAMEMEVLDVIVEEDRSEEIFELLYNELDIGKPHHGIIYQTSVKRSSEYKLPSEEELIKIQALAASDKK